MPSGRKSRAFGLINWARAVEADRLTASARHVLLLLATYADAKTRLCVPGVARLSRETGLARSTVQTSLAQLEESGLIVRQRRHRDTDGGYTSNIYELRPVGSPEGDARPPGMGSPTTGHGDARPPGNKNSHDEQPREQPENTPLAGASGGNHDLERFQELLDEWPDELDEFQIEQARAKFERHLRYRVDPQTMIDGARRLADSGEYVPELRRWLVQQSWKAI